MVQMLRHSKIRLDTQTEFMDLARPGSRPLKDFYLQNSFTHDRLG